MKIIHNTPERFIIVERPWLLAAILMAFTAAIVNGLVTNWAETDPAERTLLVVLAVSLPLGAHHFVHWVRAEFDRTTGRVDIFRRGLFHDQHRAYSLRYLNCARVDAQSHEGATWRAVLVFDKAMLSEMDPERRERLERRKARGFRQAATHETPLTAYFSSTSDAGNVAKALNDWLGAQGQGALAPTNHRFSRPPQRFVIEDARPGPCSAAKKPYFRLIAATGEYGERNGRC